MQVEPLGLAAAGGVLMAGSAWLTLRAEKAWHAIAARRRTDAADRLLIKQNRERYADAYQRVEGKVAELDLRVWVGLMWATVKLLAALGRENLRDRLRRPRTPKPPRSGRHRPRANETFYSEPGYTPLADMFTQPEEMTA